MTGRSRGAGETHEPAPCSSSESVFYSEQSRVTDPGEHLSLLRDLPRDISELHRMANGLVIHFRLNDLVAAGIPRDRIREVDLRHAEAIFSRLLELDEGPIAARRAPANRVVGCCRDFTVLFLSMARALGIPARARVGFASYLFPDVFNDHAIAEVWDTRDERWRLVDPQIGDEHRDPTDGACIDPVDIPRDRFLVAGAAWESCKSGQLEPSVCIVHPDIDTPFMRGWPYLAHNLVFDLAALNREEMLLWDVWGLAGKVFAGPTTSDECELLERVAEQSRSPRLTEVLTLYEAHDQLKVPGQVASFSPARTAPRVVEV